MYKVVKFNMFLVARVSRFCVYIQIFEIDIEIENSPDFLYLCN
jgi:hypothetical protein